jgi:hypothetical protein
MVVASEAISSGAALLGKLRFFAVELARINDGITSNSIDRKRLADLQGLSGVDEIAMLPARSAQAALG